MGELIDPTLIVCGSRRPLDPELIEAGVERVARHYEATAAGGLERRGWVGERSALVCLTGVERTCRWPALAEDPEHLIASAYVPTGPSTGGLPTDPRQAALGLARRLAADPTGTAARLDAPISLATVDKARERVLIANDPLGAGRLYEAAYDGLTILSNRLGALPLMAGTGARADRRAWELFAAMGWFIRDATPVEGTGRVAAGTVIEIAHGELDRHRCDGLGPVLAASPRDPEALLEAFIAEATEVARIAERVFPERPRVDLSGGRDSRLAAAVFVGAGVPARFVTSDMTVGEADVARSLVSAAPAELEHEVKWAGSKRKVYDKGLRERALAIHLLHDGMRHAAKVRGKMTLPPRPSAGASISGHGGEIAHGFYYANARQLAELRRGGASAPLERLEQAARRRHRAARPACYELARTELQASLDEGAAYGIEGPALLDFFYLAERFAHRSGLAADAERLTFFSCHGFLAAAFSLSPEQRLQATLHRAATAALVPAWADVPYFKAKPRSGGPGSLWGRLRGRRSREEKRSMIWEGSDGAELEEMIEAEGAWSELYEPTRVREIWRLARRGSADPHYQDAFEGIAYREAFEDYLELLSARATVGPPLAAAH